LPGNRLAAMRAGTTPIIFMEYEPQNFFTIGA
jgi:hypothetical protein